jgi:hypothetical protein
MICVKECATHIVKKFDDTLMLILRRVLKNLGYMWKST